MCDPSQFLHLAGQTVHLSDVGGAVGGGRGGDALLAPPAQAQARQHWGQLQRLFDLLQLDNPGAEFRWVFSFLF